MFEIMDLLLRVICICLVTKFTVVQSVVDAVSEDCSSFSNKPQNEGFLHLLPSRPAADVNLKSCGIINKSCCTLDVEEKLKDNSRQDYEKIMQKTLLNMNKILKMNSIKFNEFFKDLLNKSKKDFHEMFKKTYGMVYEQNSYLFSNFYGELEKYFMYGKSNLADVMDNFFNILYQKMFTVMNSQYQFDDKYLGCVSEHMNELKPFGDIPPKLSLPLKRSFVAARIYSQSLSIVGDVLENILQANIVSLCLRCRGCSLLHKLIPSEPCLNAITRMSHCSSCKGVHTGKVCHGFCLNVMKGCLAFHSELDFEWNNFVDALYKVQQRLLGPFNLQLVVEPMNVKISEAIMNFQESASQVSSRVYNGCGKPAVLTHARKRRQTNFDPTSTHHRNNRNFTHKRRRIEHTDPDTNTNRSYGVNDMNSKPKESRKHNNLPAYLPSPMAGFLKFIHEVGDQVLKTKFFWKRFPRTVCVEEMNVENNRSSVCWNGNSMGSYNIPEVGDGLKNQYLNKEVFIDMKQHMTTITEQIFTLRTVSSQLRNAYNGHDVEWIDTEDVPDAGSGSGMFPGRDDEDFSIFEGSGHEDSPESSTTISSTINFVPINEKNEDSRITASNSETTTDINAKTITNNTFGTTFMIIPNSNTTASVGTTVMGPKISFNKAIATYLLPTIVLWIGGSLSNWSQLIVPKFE